MATPTPGTNPSTDTATTAGQIPPTMHAAAIDHFGGVETLAVRDLPVPRVDADDVLIHVESAGVGVWDPFEREGGFAKMMGQQPKFPYVLGSDGAGTVAAVGNNVKDFKPGDRVYAMALSNSKGGFYAEYAAVKSDLVSPAPAQLSIEQAGAMPVDAITALSGLDDTLHLKRGESVLIFGAGGGIGHLAVQLAKRMGARVFAVASGKDGVELARQLGADAAVDGRSDDILAAIRQFAPDGLDAALLTAGGEQAELALSAIRDGGRVAFPSGVEPEPKARAGTTVTQYDGQLTHDAIDRLNRLIGTDPFDVHVARTFPLDQAQQAHRALDEHYLGKLILRPS